MKKYTNIGINYWKHKLSKKTQKIGTIICWILVIYLLACWVDVNIHNRTMEAAQNIGDWNIFKIIFRA